MNKHILNTEVQQFIRRYQDDTPSDIALQKSPFPEVSSAELAVQIDGRKRCQKKLPLWFNTPNIYYPPKLNIEQSSSELTAEYKSRLIKGDTLADLTGGFGADACYFAKRAKEVVHIEQNKELSEIAGHNSEALGIKNISFIQTDSIRFLESTDKVFDTIYIDPGRRIQTKKMFLLKDTEPDVVANLSLLLSKARRIIIKTSPLFDIQSGLKELQQVSEVHVISVKNDCKELLWVIDKGFEGEARIHCTALNNEGEKNLLFFYSEERAISIGHFSDPKPYLYEPDVALLKAGCFKLIAERFNILKIHPNTHLYTSDLPVNDFAGKVFKTVAVFEYKAFSKNKGARKANVISRNFPLSVDELKKKHRLRDGGDSYLIFTTGQSGKLIVIEAERN